MDNFEADMPGSQSAGGPQPHATINCQDLLCGQTMSHSGWLRRRTRITKKIHSPFFKSMANQLTKKLRVNWIQAYVVLDEGCIYFFKDERATKPAKTKSLFGYNRVLRAGEITRGEAPTSWIFKIVHCHGGDSTTYFCAASEREMKAWMVHFKKEMVNANEQSVSPSDLSFCLAMKEHELIYDDVEKELFPPSKGPPPLPRRKTSKDHTDQSCAAPDHEDSDSDYEEMLEEEIKQVKTLSLDRQAKPLAGGKGFGIALPGIASGSKKSPRLKKSRSVSEEATVEPAKPKPRPRPKIEKSRSLPDETLRQREPPDGRDNSPVQHVESPEEEEKRLFWQGVYWYGTDKEKANEIIRNIGKTGAYLVRVDPNTNEKVLVVYLKVPMKYKVKKTERGFSLEEKAHFPSVEELLCHYYESNLPNSEFKLQSSYSQHQT